jgi:hypothetical protein
MSDYYDCEFDYLANQEALQRLDYELTGELWQIQNKEKNNET